MLIKTQILNLEYTDTFLANQIDDNGVIFIGGLNYSTTPTGTGSEYFEVHERDPYSWMFDYNGKGGDSLLELGEMRICTWLED
jgi:hypothetical protein